MKTTTDNIGASTLIVFSVKQQSFCIEVIHVKSIQKLPRIFPVPQAPQHIMGVVNIDGEVLPLINATLKLSIGEYFVPENPTMLVLEQYLNGKPQKLGLHVDEVNDVVECRTHELRPLPTSKYEFDERLVDGTFQINNEFVMKLNVKNFFKHNLDELNPELTLTTH